MGFGSKMIVTGDDTQIDLPSRKESGLVDATNRLSGVDGVAVVRLVESDIVRHPLVQRVVEAYGPRPPVANGRTGPPPDQEAPPPQPM